MAQRRKSAFQISYVTITYRSVLMGVLGVGALAAAVVYFAFPDTSNRIILSTQTAVGRLLNKIGVSSAGASGPLVEPGPQQAHFTNIDGVVRVKKASSNTWVTADYNVALERNDVVQTSGEGIAKVVFTDGTSYTVKPDSLIVIQENSVTASSDTKVSVKLNTGTVDLATSNAMTRGSKSQVTVGDAVASIAPDTLARASNDPRTDQHEVLVRKGAVEVVRGNQTERLGNNDKVSFTSDSTRMEKTKEIAPPMLLGPKDRDTVRMDPQSRGVTFSWAPADGVHAYHIKISRHQYFKKDIVAEETNWPHTEYVKNLGPGEYFWEVSSLGDNGRESVPGTTNMVRVIPKGDGTATILLEVDLRQHGHVFEIRGKTESGARVMVNGQEVALISSEGNFSYFTNPLPTGENVITVSAQNTKGGFNIVSKPVNIQ